MEYGPRTRFANVDRTIPVYRSRYNRNGFLDTAQMGYVGNKTEDRMDDVVIEDFFSRRAAGELFNNPMQHVRSEISMDATSGNIQQTDYFSDPILYTGSWNFITIHGVPHLGRRASFSDAVASAVSSSTTKAFSKVTSQEATLLVTLGELKETTQMLKAASYSLLKLYPLVKNFITAFEFASKKKQTRMIYSLLENSWMQMRFGWLPFISDIKNLRKAMESVENKYTEQTFRAGIRLTDQQADTYTVNNGNAVFSYSRTLYETVNISAGVFCRMRYGGVPDTFGLTKYPQTAWELLKLSWFVDYFFDVGDLIGSFTPDSLWTPQTNWVTVRSKIVSEIRFQSYSEPYHNSNLSGGSHSIVSNRVNRYPDVPRSFTPHLRPRLNWARDLDTFALARQKFGKKVLKNLRKIAGFLKRK